MASEEDIDASLDCNFKNADLSDDNEFQASGDDADGNGHNKFGVRKVFLKENMYNKDRENISSSSFEDDDTEPEEMPAQFKAEWGDISQSDDSVNAGNVVEIEASGTDNDGNMHNNMHNKIRTKKQFPKRNTSNKDRENMFSSSSDEDEDTASIEMPAQFNAEWKNISQFDDNFSNTIDTKNIKSLGLLNDIAVNDIAANQLDFSLNPDAEYIDSYNIEHDNHMMSEKYEKLSLDDGVLK